MGRARTRWGARAQRACAASQRHSGTLRRGGTLQTPGGRGDGRPCAAIARASFCLARCAAGARRAAGQASRALPCAGRAIVVSLGAGRAVCPGAAPGSGSGAALRARELAPRTRLQRPTGLWRESGGRTGSVASARAAMASRAKAARVQAVLCRLYMRSVPVGWRDLPCAALPAREGQRGLEGQQSRACVCPLARAARLSALCPCR